MGTEKLTSDNLLRHMSDDPCVVCGDSGHNAWGTCKKLSGPISHTSPLVKIFGPGNKASTARTTIITYRKPNSGKTPWVEPAEPAADAPAPVDAKAQAQADAEAAAKVEDKMISEAIDPDNKSIEGLKKVRDITQAETVVTRAAASKSLPDNVKLGLSNSFAPKKVFSKSRTSLFPLRKEFAKEGLNEVFTNHFEVKFKPNTRFFVYEILRIPNAKSKRKAKYIFKTAEEAWDVLRSNRDQYATDHVKTIVAWKNLHESMTYQRVVPGDQTTNSGAVWLPEAIADGNERIQLAIKFHWELDLAGLNAYLDASHADSKADFNFNPIVDALNLAVTKSLTDKVFQQSTNKFFVKCGSVNLGRTLCTIRGYYYTIKPGMQKVLLNVNAATSAFFQPTTVGEYLNDNTTFPLDEREKTLKLLRVYIEPDRKVDPNNQEHVDHLNKPQNRIKTFFGYGEKLNHPDMTFKKGYKDAQGVWQTETKPTTVEKHMEAVFGKSFDPTQPAINVGTKDDPIYYPREYLRILPYQIYKRLLPDSLVPEMLNSATHLPARSRQLVEVEGMNSLGLDPTQTEQPLVSINQATSRTCPLTHLYSSPDALSYSLSPP
jgi:eukaryotic translation initiation factor 2C